MTAPGGLPLKALQFYGAARGAVAQRVSTAGFYQALNNAAAGFGMEGHGLTFQEVNQLRSAAAGVRNAGESFTRAPGSNVIEAKYIGVEPYARSIADRDAQPLYHVGINLTTADRNTGELTTSYKRVQFTGQLSITKDTLLTLVQQDAEQLAAVYETEYIGHDVLEILAV